jgi:hypothetical protein
MINDAAPPLVTVYLGNRCLSSDRGGGTRMVLIGADQLVGIGVRRSNANVTWVRGAGCHVDLLVAITCGTERPLA